MGSGRFRRLEGGSRQFPQKVSGRPSISTYRAAWKNSRSRLLPVPPL